MQIINTSCYFSNINQNQFSMPSFSIHQYYIKALSYNITFFIILQIFMQVNHRIYLMDLQTLDIKLKLESQFNIYRSKQSDQLKGSIFDRGNKQVRCQKTFESKILKEVFICVQCSQEENTIICIDCFDENQHKEHQVYRDVISGGNCDCGISRKLKKDCFCKRHRIEQISIKEELAEKFVGTLINYFKNIIFLYYQLGSMHPNMRLERVQQINKLEIYASQLLKNILQLDVNKPIMNQILIKVLLHDIQNEDCPHTISHKNNGKIVELLFEVLGSFGICIKLFGQLLHNALQNEVISDLSIIKYLQLYKSDPILVQNNLKMFGADVLSSSLSISQLAQQKENSILFFHIDPYRLKQKFYQNNLTIQQIKQSIKSYYCDWSYLLSMRKQIVVNYLYKTKDHILLFPCHLYVFYTDQALKEINNKFYAQLERKCIRTFIQIVSILMDEQGQTKHHQLNCNRILQKWIELLKSKLDMTNASQQNLFFTYERMWTICVYSFISRYTYNSCFYSLTIKDSKLSKDIKKIVWGNIKQSQINQNYSILLRKLINYLKKINPMFLHNQSQSKQTRQNFQRTYLQGDNFLSSIDILTFQIIRKLMDEHLFNQTLYSILSSFQQNQGQSNTYSDYDNLVFIVKVIECCVTELADLILASQIPSIFKKKCYQQKYQQYYIKIYNSIKVQSIDSLQNLRSLIEYLFVIENISFQEFIKKNKCIQKDTMCLIQSSSNQCLVNINYEITYYYLRFHDHGKIKYVFKETNFEQLVLPKIWYQRIPIQPPQLLMNRINKQLETQNCLHKVQFILKNLQILQKLKLKNSIYPQNNTNQKSHQLSFEQQRLQLEKLSISYQSMILQRKDQYLRQNSQIPMISLQENKMKRNNMSNISLSLCAVCFTQYHNRYLFHPFTFYYARYPYSQQNFVNRKIFLLYSCNHCYHPDCKQQYQLSTSQCYQCEIERDYEMEEISLNYPPSNYKLLIQNLLSSIDQADENVLDMDSNITQDQTNSSRNTSENTVVNFLVDSCLFYLFVVDEVTNPTILLKKTYNGYKNMFRMLKLISKKYEFSEYYWKMIFKKGQFQNENNRKLIPLFTKYLMNQQFQQQQHTTISSAFISSITRQIKQETILLKIKEKYSDYQKVLNIIRHKDSFCPCKKHRHDSYILMKAGWQSKLQNFQGQIPIYCFKCLIKQVNSILDGKINDRCLAFDINTGIFHIYVLSNSILTVFHSQSAYLNQSLTPFDIKSDFMRKSRQTFELHKWTFEKVQTDYLSYYYYISTDYKKRKAILQDQSLQMII